MKKLILFFCSCFLAGNLMGQTTFIKTMDDGSGVDHTQHNMIQLEDQSIIIAGTASPGTASGMASDIYVQRVDFNGTVLWGKYFYYTNSSFVGGLTQNLESGNIVLTGYTETATGGRDMVLIEIGINGNYVNDMIIEDLPLAQGGQDYELYGLDIEYSEDIQGYIVVGMGTSFISTFGLKYGFVMGLDGNFNILWHDRYSTGGGNNIYDSFNEVLRIPAAFNPNGVEAFFVRGIRTDPNPTLSPQVNMNFLFNAAGSILAHTENEEYNDIFGGGGLALYSRNREEIITAQTIIEGQIELTTYDMSLNIVDRQWVFVQQESYPTTMVTGLEWQDDAEKDFVMHTFLFDHDRAEVKSCLLSINYNNKTPNWARIYAPILDMNGYAAVNFDNLVKPVEYYGGGGRLYGQLYYQPRALIRDRNTNHFIFTGLRFGDTNPITMLLYNTDNIGEIGGSPDQCKYDIGVEITNQVFNQVTPITNIPALFDTIGQGVSDVSSPAQVTTYCNINTQPVYPRPAKTKKEPIQGYGAIEVYPNPAQSTLNIHGVKKGEASIFDIHGRLVKKLILESINSMIDVSNLTPGIYLLKISDTQGVIHTEKLIKE